MQVFIFGASRTQSSLVHDEAQLVIQKLVSGQRVLDWIIHGFTSAGVPETDITFVGGYKIESVINLYPNLNYCVNPRWNETHVVGSLRYALESWKGGDVLLIYADTIFRPEILKKFVASQSPVVVGIDKEWLKRIADDALVTRAEKVTLAADGRIDRIGRRDLPIDDTSHQFTGLTRLGATVAARLRSLFEKPTPEIRFSDRDSLSDILTVLKNSIGYSIDVLDVSNNWAELDSAADLAKFVLGTKAETLDRISPFVRKAKVCEQFHFDLKTWERSRTQILNEVQRRFGTKQLIVRSSSLEEDSWISSQAGAFLSVANVPANDVGQLEMSIDKVAESFTSNGAGNYNPHNQVLIQPLIANVAMSGVAFSRHLENGTPYFVINYDDCSKKTDTVTSGSSSTYKSVTIYRHASLTKLDGRLVSVVDAIRELEAIIGYSSLDVEFVYTVSNELYIVQVRPITTHAAIVEAMNFEQRFEDVQHRVRCRMQAFPHVFGRTTVLADMPDWNPAEMIGVRPSPLSASLYQYLITDSAWREARAMIGYHNPTPEKLLFCIAGHPYIDVRNSFNNLIPAGLSPELSERLIDHYIARLQEHPHLHDKVEFEIAITCYTPDFDTHAQRLRDAGFTRTEIRSLERALRTLTRNAISGVPHSIESLVAQSESLNPRRAQLLSNRRDRESIPDVVQVLLDDCIRYGTIPFSVLARFGFIASSLLRGFVCGGIVSQTEFSNFLNSIETIAGRMVKDMNAVVAGTYPLDKFLDTYGHLRPGSYDITSLSYRENPAYYFPDASHVDRTSTAVADDTPGRDFGLSKDTIRAMEDELQRMELGVDCSTLLRFVREATAAREDAKFQFTKNLSAVLELLATFGQSYGFSREDVSFLFIEDILKLHKHTVPHDTTLYLKQKIQEGREWYVKSNRIETPQILFGPDDLEVIHHNPAHPNFVTTKSVSAPICKLTAGVEKENLNGRIVLIEGADPGYDWIFLFPIKGLITKYGGAGSHMTIRCAEFGLPAAIGCGEELHNRLTHARNVELDCAKKQIRIIN